MDTKSINEENYPTVCLLLSSRPSPRYLPGWDWESGWESWFTSINKEHGLL